MPTVCSWEVGTDFRVWSHSSSTRTAARRAYLYLPTAESRSLVAYMCIFHMQPKLNPISSWANIFMYIIFTHLYSSVGGRRRQTVRWREKWTCTRGKMVWKCDVKAFRLPTRTPSGCIPSIVSHHVVCTECVCVFGWFGSFVAKIQFILATN